MAVDFILRDVFDRAHRSIQSIRHHEGFRMRQAFGAVCDDHLV